MMKKAKWIPILILMLVLSSGCGGNENNPADEDVDALYTSIAETAFAQLTLQSTEQPTQTSLPISTLGSTATQGSFTNSPVSTSTPIPGGGVDFSNCDKAEFGVDVTIPDGTELSPGTVFTKTWQIKNIGTCTWDENYQLVYYYGSAMGAADTHQITTGSVAPGEPLEISIELTAPINAGEYFSGWRLKNAKGEYFSSGDELYTLIKVGTPSTTETSTPTSTGAAPVDTSTPTNTGVPTDTQIPTDTPIPVDTDTPIPTT